MSTAVTGKTKTSGKKAVPPAGRKLGQREAIEQVNKQFAKALAKLAK
jgi:hypothetical protein